MDDFSSILIAFIASLAAMQIILCITKRRHRHKTFKRMQIDGPKPNLIHGHLYETRREPYVKFAHKMHEKYGKNVGIYLGGDPYLMTKDLELIQQVFVANSRIFYDRMDFYMNVDPVPDNLICQRGDRWRYMRKLLTPAFTNSKIKTNQFYRDTQQTIRKFMHQLDANSILVAKNINDEIDTTKSKSNLVMRRETVVEDSYDRMAAVALDVIVKTAFHMDNVISFNGTLCSSISSLTKGKDKSAATKILPSSEQDIFLSTVKRACRLAFNPLVELIFCFPFLDKPLTFLCNRLYFGSIITFLFKRLDYLVRRADHPESSKAIKDGKQQITKSSATATANTSNNNNNSGHKQRRIIDSLIEVLREKKITRSEFTGNAFVIVFAGFETTANALTFTLWLLAKNERVQCKLRKQLQSQMEKITTKAETKRNQTTASTNDSGGETKDKDDINGSNTDGKGGEKNKINQQLLEDLADKELAELAFGCEYLEMVLNESLRLYPPVPGLSCRQASVDCMLASGLKIEKGVNVIPSVFSIHRDKSIWGQDANLFKPERFEMLDIAQLNSAMFMPFGLGPRNCIGKAAAMHEMKIVIGRLILGYSIEPLSGGKTPDKLKLCSPINITITNAEKIGLKFVKLD